MKPTARLPLPSLVSPATSAVSVMGSAMDLARYAAGAMGDLVDGSTVTVTVDGPGSADVRVKLGVRDRSVRVLELVMGEAATATR